MSYKRPGPKVTVGPDGKPQWTYPQEKDFIKLEKDGSYNPLTKKRGY